MLGSVKIWKKGGVREGDEGRDEGRERGRRRGE
jgi:hypothetical protein